MNREIKFRVWDKEKKKHLYYDTDIVPCMTLNGVLQGNNHTNLSYKYILEQYTGLHDKNGKEIYERDEIEWFVGGYDNNYRLNGIITWYFDQWRIVFVPCKCCGSFTCENYSQVPRFINHRDWLKCEIIGTIHTEEEQ